MASLLDFLGMGGLHPTGGDGGLLANFNGAGTSYGDVMGALNNNRNMIAGLGLGLMSGTKYNPYGNVMQGFAQGSALDTARMKAQRDNLPNDVKEYQYAKSTGMFDGTYPEWLEKKANFSSQYGLNPYVVETSPGKFEGYQLNNRGPARRIEVGGPAVGNRAVDTGQGTVIVPNKGSGVPLQPFDAGATTSATDAEGRPVVRDQPPGYIPKDIEGREAAKERGEARGKVQADLPRIEQNAQGALDTIQAIRAHPGKQYGTGMMGILPGIPGTQQKDFVSLVDQAKGKAFLEAYNTLKGGGQITEIEGKKATDAIARLDRTQSTAGFDRALNDLEDVIKTGLARARKQGGRGASQPNNDPFGLR